MVSTPIQQSANPTSAHPQSVRETINWLIRLGRPPLPECPIEAAKQGKEPKAPCFLDGKYLKSVSWKQWQHTQPIEEIYTAWFKNPKTGIGTLGGWNGKHWLGWIDIDLKHFASGEECDRVIAEWLNQYPLMKNAPMFRTPSGGYRFLVAFSREPENFKANSGFSLKSDGSHHIGELLSKNGGHTLLPPTIGVSGEAYQWGQWCEYPPIVDQPEDIGMYPVQKKTASVQQSPPPRKDNLAGDSGNSLSNLLNNEINPRFTLERAFDWHGHDFRQYGSKLKGNCPWHDSRSGTSFYAEIKDGSPVWRCPACEIGGSVIEYRHRIAGGNGSPRGAEFAALVKELASEVGVTVPDFKREPNNNRRSFGGGSGGNSGDGGDGSNESKILQFPGGDGSPLAFVKQVLSETKSKSERDSAFVSSRYNPRDLQKIARELEREEDITEEKQEAKEALPRLLQKPSLDPRDYLWGDGGQLAQAIVDTANAMPANPSKLFTTLIPVAATPIGASSRIVVKPSAKYLQPCIFWTGIADPTGSNKSGIQGAITSPLIRLEIEANQRYQAELEDYDIKFAQWQKAKGAPEDKPKKPTRKRYLTKDSTIATLERIHGENPRGILVNSEELVADFKRENAHTGGRGADRESKLDQWNGSCFLTDRAERTVVLERTAISRTGTIQLETLQNLFRDASIFDSGMIPRWLFDAASSPPRFIEFDDAPDTGIDDLLTQLYKRLEKMPQADYLLSAEAKPVFRDWQHSLVRRTIAEDGAIKQILPKIEAYTARFALWLHVVNAALAEITPPPTISALTMSRAVALAQYYLKQWEFILAINSPDLSLTGILLKMYEHIKNKPNGVKISLLKSNIRALRGTDKKEVHNHCLWLVDNGYAVITDNIITALQKDGGDRVYDIYDNFMTPCHKVQPTTTQEFDKFYDTYDTKTEVAEVLSGTNEVHYKVENPPPENVICHKSDVLMVETTVVQSVDTHDTGVINAVITHDTCHEQVTVEADGDELIDAVMEVPATEVVTVDEMPQPMPQQPQKPSKAELRQMLLNGEAEIGSEVRLKKDGKNGAIHKIVSWDGQGWAYKLSDDESYWPSDLELV